MNPGYFNAALLAYLAGAVAGLAFLRRPAAARLISFSLALAGALIETAVSAISLVRGVTTEWTLPSGIPLFAWTARLDPMSALFCLALGILAVAVSIFSFGYLRDWEGRKNVGVL